MNQQQLDEQIERELDEFIDQIATRHAANQRQSNLPYDPTWVDPAVSIPKDVYKTKEQVDNERAFEAYERAKKLLK